MRVQTGDNVGIGGFIISGSVPKRLLVRAIGPSLTRYGITDPLLDPVLELHGPAGFTTVINDNWRDSQMVEIEATGIPPVHDLESAILRNLNPGAYTAIVRGNGNTAGVALVEVYDLNQGVNSKLANLSTRAFVSIGDNIVIAGFLLSDNDTMDRIVLRGIGPSLAPALFPVAAVLADPNLELRDANGSLLISNNDWQDNPVQAAEITAAGLAPTNPREAAIAATLPPGLYTALLFGTGAGTGIGVVEVYDLDQAGLSKLGNISTRAFVSTADNIVIAGFILGNNTGNDKVIVRGLGPSLTSLLGAELANPALELRNSNGALLFFNNDWQDNPAHAAEIVAAGLAPSNNLESAIAATLPPGLYTALLAGRNNGVGIGVVEVYNIGSP